MAEYDDNIGFAFTSKNVVRGSFKELENYANDIRVRKKKLKHDIDTIELINDHTEEFYRYLLLKYIEYTNVCDELILTLDAMCALLTK